MEVMVPFQMILLTTQKELDYHPHLQETDILLMDGILEVMEDERATDDENMSAN